MLPFLFYARYLTFAEDTTTFFCRYSRGTSSTLPYAGKITLYPFAVTS